MGCENPLSLGLQVQWRPALTRVFFDAGRAFRKWIIATSETSFLRALVV
jgi:hypothetical protein